MKSVEISSASPIVAECCRQVLHGRLHLLVVHDGSVTTMAFEARHLRASEVSARDLGADQRPDPPTLESKQLFADVTDDWSPITGMCLSYWAR